MRVDTLRAVPRLLQNTYENESGRGPFFSLTITSRLTAVGDETFGCHLL